LNQLGFCSWLHSVTDATERERGGKKSFGRSIISPPHKARTVFLDRMLMTYWLPSSSSSSRLH
jgi:hypothetical protein